MGEGGHIIRAEKGGKLDHLLAGQLDELAHVFALLFGL